MDSQKHLKIKIFEIILISIISLFTIGTIIYYTCFWEYSFYNCYYPNDRAIFNLQGKVKSVKYPNAKLEIVFTEDGYITTGTSSYINDIYNNYSRMTSYLNVTFTDGNSTLVTEFDKKGRLKYKKFYGQGVDFIDRITQESGVTATTFKYKRKGLLPNKERVEHDENSSDVYPITYATVDSHGNWLSMTKDGQTEVREIEYYDDTQVINCPTERFFNWSFLGGIILSLLVSYLLIALLLGIIYHIVCELFFYKIPANYTVDFFKTRRIENNLPEEATLEENQKAHEYLEQLFATWTTIRVEGDDEYRAPLYRKRIKQSRELIQLAIDENPTDPDVVTTINDLSTTINDMKKRVFTASKLFIGITLIFGIIIGFAADAWYALTNFLIPSIIFYICANMKPTFMIIRSQLNGRSGNSKFMTRLFGGLFASIATARTYKVITTYSDGTTDEKTDNSETWFAMIFAFIIMVFLVFFMFAIAAISYVRYYIIYR